MSKLVGLISRGDLLYVGSRYVAVLVVAAEALTFARLLGPDSYGHYALIVQLVALIPALINPSTNGYMYAYYRDYTAQLSTYYLVGSLLFYSVVTAILFLVLLAVSPYLALSVVLFWIQAVHFLLEPMLRVRNQFVLTTVGRAMGSAAALLALAFWFVLALPSRQLDLPTAVVLMLVGNVVGYAFYACLIVRLSPVRLPSFRAAGVPLAAYLRGYWDHILRNGLQLSFYAIIYMLFTYVDRMFIERYRSSEILGTYTLAWQLAQGGGILLTSLGVLAQVRIGEALSNDPANVRHELRKQLIPMVGAAALVLTGVTVAAWLLSVTLYTDYVNLAPITIIIASGYAVLNVSGAITPLLHYEKRLRLLCTGNAILLLVVLVTNVATIYFGLPYILPVITSAVMLALVTVYFMIETRKLAIILGRREPERALT